MFRKKATAAQQGLRRLKTTEQQFVLSIRYVNYVQALLWSTGDFNFQNYCPIAGQIGCSDGETYSMSTLQLEKHSFLLPQGAFARKSQQTWSTKPKKQFLFCNSLQTKRSQTRNLVVVSGACIYCMYVSIFVIRNQDLFIIYTQHTNRR